LGLHYKRFRAVLRVKTPDLLRNSRGPPAKIPKNRFQYRKSGYDGFNEIQGC
jgi:hypothetical protein